MEDNIEITLADSKMAGSCNACTKHLNVEAMSVDSHQVAVVRLRGLEFRLCKECTAILMKMFSDLE